MAIFTGNTDNIFASVCKFDNDLDLLRIVIEIYSATVLRKHLVGELERVALRFYLKGGYNDVSQQAIMQECGMKGGKGKRHLDQINYKLTKKGFLQRHPTNYRSKVVNKDLINLKNRFLTAGEFKADYYLIKFQK